jgi:hypothetical protein
MTDQYIQRCSVCGTWIHTEPMQRLQMLLGEQLVCAYCKKGTKNAA